MLEEAEEGYVLPPGPKFTVVPATRANVLVLPLQSSPSLADNQDLNANDDTLADLQPEDSEDEEDGGEGRVLSQEQQKLEFMAALGIVPPAVLEEIHRRQQICRAEYGNWWDRLHSTDFCLVPKTENVISTGLQVVEECVGEVTSTPSQQVATGPDAGALVEQITYLTSWPQSSSSVEVATTPGDPEQQRTDLLESLKDQYMQLAAMKQLQVDDQQLQATLQQLVMAGTFNLTQ